MLPTPDAIKWSFRFAILTLILGVLAFAIGLFVPSSEAANTLAIALFMASGTQVLLTELFTLKQLDAERMDQLKRIESCLQADKLCQQLAQDEWLRTTAEALTEIRQLIATNPFKLFHIEQDITRRIGLRRAQAAGARISYPKDEERYRMDFLLEASKLCKHCYMAVTIVAGEYFENFFTGEFSDDLFEAHAAIRSDAGAAIERVFVIDSSMLMDSTDDQVTNRRNLLRTIVNKHRRHGYEVQIVLRSQLAEACRTRQASFAICDRQMGSESYSIDDDGKTDGYITFSEDDIQRLHSEFRFIRNHEDHTSAFLSSFDGTRR